MRGLILALCLAVVPAAAWAVQPDEILKDPKLETRARDISTELRCLVCQNQSIDDSDAPLARDLRIIVRERLQAGDSDTEVRDYLVRRYGDFILLRPPFKTGTLLLWLTPAAVLLLGAGALLLLARRRREPESAVELTEVERQQIAAIVGKAPGEKR